MAVRAVSFGGGVQSTAILVLAARGELDFPVMLFANVGDDSEHPATLAYVRDVSGPYARQHGLELHELRRTFRGGVQAPTLWESLQGEGRSVHIPVRMANGAPGNRRCTADYKIRVVGRWLRDHGATREAPATVAIGFSIDEVHRIGRKSVLDFEEPVYPLVDLGLSRADCLRVIADAGLPPTPKSSCFFCPFHNGQAWAEMRRDEPALFDKAAELEATLNRRRDVLGKDHVFLTRFGRPLEQAVVAAQDTLDGFDGPGEDQCDEGYCWT